MGFGLVLLPLFLTGGQSLGASAGHGQLTREELLSCGRCHSMEREVATWQSGPHSDLACLACHEAGDPNWVRHEFSDRSDQMAEAVGGTIHQTLPIKVPDERCTDCHAPQQDALMRDLIPAPLQPTASGAAQSSAPGSPMTVRAMHHLHMNEEPDLSCTDCHSVHADPAKAPDQSHQRCLTCHDEQKVTIPVSSSTGCAACHTDPAAVAPETHKSASQWLDRHGTASSVQLCGQCHLAQSAGPHGPLGDPARFPSTSDACAACHAGVPMPHPADYLSGHGSASLKASPGTCENCHTPARSPIQPPPVHAGASFCKDCHLQPMPHPSSFVNSHGFEALKAPATCSACHSNQNPARPTAAHASPSFCANCHSGYQHPAGWVGGHGEKVDASCSTCHATGQSGGHNACSECHTASGEWHPNMWFVSHARAVATEGEAGCARCHDHVEPSCSKCHRSR